MPTWDTGLWHQRVIYSHSSSLILTHSSNGFYNNLYIPNSNITKQREIFKHVIGGYCSDIDIDIKHMPTSIWIPTSSIIIFHITSNFTPSLLSHKNIKIIVFYISNHHYSDVLMSTMVYQITSVSIVYSTICSGPDQRNIKAMRHWPLWDEFTSDWWILRTKGH